MTTPRVTKNTLVTPFHLNGNAAAGVANSVTTPATAGLTTYITQIHVSLGLVAAAAVATLTITNILGTAFSFRLTEMVATQGFYAFQWPDGLPASATNTAMVIGIGTVASGSTSDIDVFGYQQ